jgi:hypothetical protein
VINSFHALTAVNKKSLRHCFVRTYSRTFMRSSEQRNCGSLALNTKVDAVPFVLFETSSTLKNDDKSELRSIDESERSRGYSVS